MDETSDSHANNNHSNVPNGNCSSSSSLCESCSRDLAGDRHVQKDRLSFCVGCYEERYANTCYSCSHKIRTDSKDLAYQNKHWHERCFLCAHCSVPLIDKLFGSNEDKLYCEVCYEELFGLKCDACAKPFKAGGKKLEWNGQQWHEECFQCTNCTTVIGCSSFLPKDTSPYCVPCFNKLFAPKCSNCSKAIMTGGIIYKNEPYHKECFHCHNCNKKLDKEKFTSRDDQPYCTECFAELFSRRCTHCNKPITGPAGTKLISFGGRFWHNECFNCSCSSCGNTNLVGKGFVMDQQDILCPDCGKLPFQKRKTNTNNNNENNVDNKNSNLGRKKADNGNANTGNGLQEISSVNKTP
ncbi:four and a half LIM domains protein 2-like [Symsagittifera roscoffensis]|uniref:four and a half LIM domains protein 2-like n=1 Tax=Symsagittifera roscoffensis TaxID=84072 RepID=UPI00307B968A